MWLFDKLKPEIKWRTLLLVLLLTVVFPVSCAGDTSMKVSKWPIEKVKFDEKNARRHSTENINAIASSLREFGQQKPVVVRKSGVLIAGAGTLEAAKRLGWTEIDVVVSMLSASKARAYSIADNRTGDMSEFDDDALLRELRFLVDDPEIDQLALGFRLDQIEAMLAIDEDEEEEEKDLDAVPELPTKIVTQLGDVWQLGEHRLVCGDSTSKEIVDSALNGRLADLVFTDPPYNMAYKSKKLGGIKNDDTGKKDFATLLICVSSQIRRCLREGGSYYVCMNAAAYPNLADKLRRSGLDHRLLIWAKPSPGLGAQEYRPQYELILFGHTGNKKQRTWNGGRAQSDLWENDGRSGVVARFEDGYTVLSIGFEDTLAEVVIEGKVSGYIEHADGTLSDVWQISRESGRDYVHPTQKPISLVRRAIENSSKPGDQVLDLFGGSGSTLVASHVTGRRASLVELDPKYCDVICERWYGLTGESAVRSDGKRFSDLKAADDEGTT